MGIKNPAVLVLAYNRKDTTERLLEQLQKIGIAKIYFYVDAPGTLSDTQACQEVRNLCLSIQKWAKLLKFFPEKNLGPRYGVARAIDWFFENEEEGIILEHDCIPSHDFVRFASEMLQTYRDNSRVMHIAGTAPYKIKQYPADYYFTRIPLIWGWATWSRAWKNYDSQMRTLDAFSKAGEIKHVVRGSRAQANWMHYFYAAAAGNLRTWDYQWSYAVMRNQGYCITPVNNMISNIGFGDGALHCTNKESRFAEMPFEALSDTIKHPDAIEPLLAIEDSLNKEVFRWKTIKWFFHVFGVNRIVAESRFARKLAHKIVASLQKN